jgi:plasmid stabilization system protein ParE
MYSIIFAKKVKQDFINIKDYISKDNPIYAIKTINSILKTINLLSSFPFV